VIVSISAGVRDVSDVLSRRLMRGPATAMKWLGDCQKSSWSCSKLCSRAERVAVTSRIPSSVFFGVLSSTVAVSSRMLLE